MRGLRSPPSLTCAPFSSGSWAVTELVMSDRPPSVGTARAASTSAVSSHSCFTAVLQEAGLVVSLAALRRDALLDEDRVARPSETTVGCEMKGMVLGGGGMGVTQGAFSSFEC